MSVHLRFARPRPNQPRYEVYWNFQSTEGRWTVSITIPLVHVELYRRPKR